MRCAKVDVHINECFECNECCWNEKPTLKVIFTAEEKAAVMACGYSPIPQFLPYRGHTRVSLLPLDSVTSAGRTRYVCPFYNNSNHLCKIYHLRPFDCRIWPFFYAHGKNPEEIYLCCYDRLCRTVTKEFLLQSPKIKDALNVQALSTLKKYPDLIWDYDETASYVIIQRIDPLLELDRKPSTKNDGILMHNPKA